MKPILLAFLFVFVACSGQKKEEIAGSAGEDRSTNPIVVDGNFKKTLKSVCDALDDKEWRLDDYVGRETFQFEYGETDCGAGRGEAERLSIQIIKNASGYQFYDLEGRFRMTEVETKTTGIMKDLCKNISAPTNPLIVGNTAIEMRNTSTRHCRNDSSNTCFHIMRGRVTANGKKYKVEESTLISFHKEAGYMRGFYTYKSVQTLGACPSGKFRTKTAKML